jgi:hypothetical protein
MNAVDVMRVCGSKWQALSADQKQAWNTKAKQ